MSAVRCWNRLHFVLMALGTLWFGLAAWALKVPFFLVAAGFCLLGAVRQGTLAFSKSELPPTRIHPVVGAIVTGLALAVCIWSLGPAIWRWIH